MADIESALETAAIGGELTCASAFALVEQLGVDPLDIGQGADALGLRLTECQLGLFGYGLKSEGHYRRVRAMAEVPTTLAQAIETALDEDGKLSCASAWRIAAQLEVSRQTVSDAAEGLGIRIRACQLGAF